MLECPDLSYEVNTNMVGNLKDSSFSPYTCVAPRPLFDLLTSFIPFCHRAQNQLKKGENLGENRANLKRLADYLFKNIIDSIPRVPLAVSLVCHGVVSPCSRGDLTLFFPSV